MLIFMRLSLGGGNIHRGEEEKCERILLIRNGTHSGFAPENQIFVTCNSSSLTFKYHADDDEEEVPSSCVVFALFQSRTYDFSISLCLAGSDRVGGHRYNILCLTKSRPVHCQTGSRVNAREQNKRMNRHFVTSDT